MPWVTRVAEKRDPYRILVSCILSLRTKDKTTAEASSRLFREADSPARMLALKKSRLSRLIYPVGFYRNKAGYIKELSSQIIDDFGGKVPDNLDDLLKLRGVGRKTANLVLGLGYGIAAICVDTHVHRISNRLGWVKTLTPEDTEFALMKMLPRRYWIELNTLLVTFGQHVCLPVYPLCSRCRVSGLCPKKLVKQRR